MPKFNNSKEAADHDDQSYGAFPSAKKASRFRALTKKAIAGKITTKELNELARLYVLAKGGLPENLELRRGNLVYKDTGKQVVPIKPKQAGNARQPRKLELER
jgi:hypothetical protein